MLKCHRFKDSGSDVTEPKASKREQMDKHDNEEGQGLDEYQGKDDRYVPLPPCSQKESNRLTHLGKRIKSLNHLVCIPKLPH